MDAPIDALKKEHGSIYAASVSGYDVIFRRLLLEEFQYLLDTDSSPMDQEDYLIAQGVVWPAEFDADDLTPGEATMLSQRIVDVSGLSSIAEASETLTELREKRSNSVATMLKAFIIAAMPTYRPEELDRLTFPELCELLVLSENVIRLQQDVAMGGEATLSIMDHSEAEEGSPEQGGVDPIAQQLQGGLDQAMQEVP